MSTLFQEKPIESKTTGISWGSWTDPDLTEKLKKRRILYHLASESTEFQQALLDKCQKDKIYWINNFCWTLDQRNLAYGKPVTIPFTLWKRQEEYIHWRDDRLKSIESGLVEKSRDAGITWCNVAWQVHQWLFVPGYKGAFGSRKEILVDRLGDPDSIFEKIRIILRFLPHWMLDKSDYSDSYLKIINKKNGSQITGEAGNNIGRGGRNLVYDVDEAAFIDQAENVDASLSNNAPIIVYTSTPNGLGNPYYAKRHGGHYPVFIFDWTDDPRKDDVWLQDQINRFGETIVAREILRDYAGSVEGICIPSKWVQKAVDWLDYKQYGTGPLIAGLDVADGGTSESVLTFRKSCIVFRQEFWKTLTATELAYAVRKRLAPYPVTALIADAQPSGCVNTFKDIDKVTRLKYEVYPFHGNGSPSGQYWEGEQQKAKDKFKNARTEAWFLLSERFRKTFEHRMKIREYPIDQLISIPNDPELIAQLSTLKIFDGVKMVLESKKDAAKRGIKSPDRGDSLAYAYAPVGLRRAGGGWNQTPVRA